MKKLLLIIAVVFTGYVVNAQNGQMGNQGGDVPENVSEKFSEEFPDVNKEDVSWQEDDFEYKAEFSQNDQKHEVVIDKAGELIYSQRDMSGGQLPENVQKELSKENINTEDITEAKVREYSENTLYKLDVEGEEMYLDKKGKKIKESKDKSSK